MFSDRHLESVQDSGWIAEFLEAANVLLRHHLNVALRRSLARGRPAPNFFRLKRLT